MLRLTLRNVLSHKVRFLLTTFAVVMGVGFAVGSFVVTDSLNASVNQLFADITAGVDVSVRAESNLDSGQAPATRGRVPADLADAIRGVDGVAAAEVVVGGYAQLVDLDGEPLTTTGAPFLGVSWGHEESLRPAALDEGRAPHGLGEVAIDRGTAADYGFTVGDRTTVLLADGTQPEVEIVGIFTFGEANNLLGARLTAFDVEIAPEVFGTGEQVDSIDVAAVEGVAPAELAERISAVLPDGVESVTSTQVVDEFEEGVGGFLSAFRNILLGFAAIALFVSAFFINNTFSIVVGQRTRQLALLRAVGASPRQITTSVVGEALVVGAMASILGIGFGLLIAIALQELLQAAGTGLPDQGLVLVGRTLIAAVVVALLVTLIASLTPARRASTIPPVQGMREGFVPTRWSSTRRGWVGGLLTLSGGALVAAGLWAVEGTTKVIGLLALGALAVFLGVAQLSPVVAVPVAGRLGWIVTRVLRVAGRLANANAVRIPERTAKTASAVMIGLALVTTVFVVGTSVKESFADSIEDAVGADYVLSTGGFIGFSPAVTDELARLPQVSSVSGLRMGRILVEGNAKDVVAAQAETTDELIDIDVQAGSLGNLDGNAIFLHEDSANDLDVTVGDQVTVEMATGGPTELTVAGIHADATYIGNYFIDLDLFESRYPTSDLDLLAFARLVDGTDPEAARAAIDEVMADHPQVTLEDRAAFQASQEERFDGILMAVNGLLGLALFIALLGIANTLALSVLERTREIGLLRAVGMRRRQVREMILVESAMVAVFGAALGIALGVVFGVAITLALPPSIVTTTAIPVGAIAVIVGVALVCGLVAGLLPARRAARLDVLRAVATAA
jgi:putative ABC transport system permease protein